MTIYEKVYNARKRYEEHLMAAKTEYEKCKSDLLYWKKRTLASNSTDDDMNNYILSMTKCDGAKNVYNAWSSTIDILKDSLKGESTWNDEV